MRRTAKAKNAQPIATRWIIDPLVDVQAARRIRATKNRHTLEARQRATRYGKAYRAKPEMKARKLEAKRRWRERLKITWPGGIVPSYIGPKPHG